MLSRENALKIFGESLRAERLRRGLTQEELAHRAQLDRSYVGGVERGERNLSLFNIIKLAHAAGIKLVSLFETLDNQLFDGVEDIQRQ